MTDINVFIDTQFKNIMSKPLPVNTQVSNLLQLADAGLQTGLESRFYADMIKDMNEKGALNSDQIKGIIQAAFDKQIAQPIKYKSQKLHNRYKLVIDENISKITQYQNILKTSVTAVSGYSNAIYQLYESGHGVKTICANKEECKSIDTAASHLDTAGKVANDGVVYFDMTISADNFASYGFPPDIEISTRWVDEDEDDEDDDDVDNKKCYININRLPKPTNFNESYTNADNIDLYPIRDQNLMLYTLGNAQKNQLLLNMYNKWNNFGNQPYTYNDITIPHEKIPSIMKYILLVKEFGDVLQIMEYYGIVTFLEERLSIDNIEIDNDNAKKKIRPKFNMQTTDSVVFDLCVSLELPCTYTGSREGVKKGGITVIMYEYE